MSDVPKTNAERSLAICSLFESELLLWLLLRQWERPFAEDTADNTVLSCSRHNRQRGCKEVVKYWTQ